MMLRIAQAPDWDTQNEGKTLTPYWAAELLEIPLAMLFDFIDMWKLEQLITKRPFRVSGYLFEILSKERQQNEN